MKKFLQSRLFLILTPIFVFVIGFVAGVLLGFQPSVSGGMGYTSTKYKFHIDTASGYWLFALVFALITLLICLVVRNQYSSCKSNDDN